MKKLILIIIIGIFSFSCSTISDEKRNSVHGNISNLPEGSTIYLDYLEPQKVITIDSTTIDNKGNYYFKYTIDQLGYYRLRISNNNFVNLVLDINEHPTINADGTNLMDTYIVKGSIESGRLRNFNIKYKENALLQDSLKNYYNANRGNRAIFDQAQITSMASSNQTNKYFIKLIEDNPGSLVSLAIVEQFDPKVYGALFKKVDEALFKKIPNSIYYKSFHKKIEQIVMLNKGDIAPDFNLNDVSGNPISLSSLKGNIVLLDFWASWCKPCRMENPNLVSAYKKYGEKGFKILSVSLDGVPQQQNPKKDWTKAIEKDKLIWDTHASELKGWQSSIVTTYGIEGIPFTLLIDKDGSILGKNLRGNKLNKKLAELF